MGLYEEEDKPACRTCIYGVKFDTNKQQTIYRGKCLSEKAQNHFNRNPLPAILRKINEDGIIFTAKHCEEYKSFTNYTNSQIFHIVRRIEEKAKQKGDIIN